MVTRLSRIPTMLALAALAATGATGASAAPDQNPGKSCFASNTWRGWSAPGNGEVLYLQVGMHDIYRVELIPETRAHRDGDRFIVNRIHGSNMICSALDLDLTLSDRQGFREPLIARSLRKLTPAEVAAIPRKDLP